jgi:hypothetical protein
MTSEAGLLAGPFLSLKKGTRSVPKTSAAKMSLLIFIAESHDMHPNGVPCSKTRAWDSYKSLAFRVMGALAQSSKV